LTDKCSLHRLILDDIGVRQIAAVVGGSMGGMLVLEYAFFGADYVRSIVPIATSSRHSAWGISWGEAQRQSIFSDPKYQSGYYAFSDPPVTGLGAARMSALLTYRSRNSFEARFGRNIPDPSRRQNINGTDRPTTPSEGHWSIHNDGHKQGRPQSRPHSRAPSNGGTPPRPHHAPPGHAPPGTATPPQFTDPQFHGATPLPVPSPPSSSSYDSNKARNAPHYFSAQSYLRYQGEKFVRRFDSNCYIAITKKLDMHDVSYGRVGDDSSDGDPVAAALATIQQPALVLGIESDGLFTFAEQQELAAHIPNATLCTIDSPEGHDAFLLQFEQVNRHILSFFAEVLPEIMSAEPLGDAGEEQGWAVLKESTFGEAEVDDITAW
jgi:homoserine O-acetyltransferase/O-succinyltransferase